MRIWAQDHPKARSLANKRRLILEAARNAFLNQGYERASMEAIAAAAGVSIMTLYRHARTKDALFEAVVSEACHPELDPAQAAKIQRVLRLPLIKVLIFVGEMFQARLISRETLGLLRAVMLEREHFPHLSHLAFEGLIESHIRQLSDFVYGRPEAKGLSKRVCNSLCKTFINDLFGADCIRALLGLSVPTSAERRKRAESAARQLMEQLPKSELEKH